MGIFDKRKNYKPFEYPEVQPLIDSINQTYWTVNEVDFTGDIQDFKTRLTYKEQEVLRRSLLAIAQVEVDVKTFWGDLYKHFPKPEFNNMGATFSENEVRHSAGYSKLLEVLNYEKDFEKILEIPVFKEKLQLIEDSMTSKTDILEKLLFFTIVIENTSLFSQFANVLSFSAMKGVMKNVSNIILWSRLDEDNHANGGILLLNLINREYPEKIQSLKSGLLESIKKYIEYESKLLDWIFEEGELDWYTKEDMLNFMKFRVDEALSKMDFIDKKKDLLFNITPQQLSPMKWWDIETKSQSLTDFFSQRPVDYSKHNQPFSEDNLF